jgi:hypothetical protein
MKALLSLVLLFTMNAVAQVPDAQPSQPPPVAEVVAARELGKKFIEAAFSEDYGTAEKMMNPNPPEKEGKSTSEFKKQRQENIRRIVENRNEKLGKSRVWDNVIDGKFRIRSERPSEEEFANFTFWCTYPNGTKSSNRVVVMKKDGRMFVELFTY